MRERQEYVERKKYRITYIGGEGVYCESAKQPNIGADTLQFFLEKMWKMILKCLYCQVPEDPINTRVVYLFILFINRAYNIAYTCDKCMGPHILFTTRF